MNITLTPSPVVFVEEPHGYWLGSQRLSGVTSLIKGVLKLGTYPDATDYVEKVAIPRAGEYGKSVHRTIQMFDDIGIRQTSHPGKFGVWETSRELESYLRHRTENGFVNVANEYTVSDNVNYASQIDNIWAKEDTGEIWLVDTKTNNLAYYPGGKQSLKEYLRWQLSIYAYLFERQNPMLTVAGIAANYLRQDLAEFWVLDRIPDERIEYLLSATWVIEDDDKFSYYLANPEWLTNPTDDIALSDTPKDIDIAADVIRTIFNVELTMKEAEELSKTMREKLRQAMRVHSVSKWSNDLFSVSLADDGVSRRFDLDKLKAEHPEIDYEKYYNVTPTKGSLRITLKGKEIV